MGSGGADQTGEPTQLKVHTCSKVKAALGCSNATCVIAAQDELGNHD